MVCPTKKHEIGRDTILYEFMLDINFELLNLHQYTCTVFQFQIKNLFQSGFVS